MGMNSIEMLRMLYPTVSEEVLRKALDESKTIIENSGYAYIVVANRVDQGEDPATIDSNILHAAAYILFTEMQGITKEIKVLQAEGDSAGVEYFAAMQAEYANAIALLNEEASIIANLIDNRKGGE